RNAASGPLPSPSWASVLVNASAAMSSARLDPASFRAYASAASWCRRNSSPAASVLPARHSLISSASLGPGESPHSRSAVIAYFRSPLAASPLSRHPDAHEHREADAAPPGPSDRHIVDGSLPRTRSPYRGLADGSGIIA